jgi:hypothetical protein
LTAEANIVGIGSVSARIGFVRFASAKVTGKGTVTAKPYKFGEEWSLVPDEANTWVPTPVDSNIWTEIQPGQNTWQ